MAIECVVKKHGFANPSAMVASHGGAHICDFLVETKPLDNGSIVAKNEWKGFHYYSYKYSTGVEGIIRDQAENGNWYVEVTAPGDGFLIYTTPMIYEEGNKFANLANFFNAVGDMARGHRLVEGDIIELSNECFTGQTIQIGKAVKSHASSYQWDVQA